MLVWPNEAGPHPMTRQSHVSVETRTPGARKSATWILKVIEFQVIKLDF